MSFFSELKRRKVFRVGLTYLIAAWLVVQVVNNLVTLLGVPDWIGKAVLIFLIAGFPVALIIAWAFELTPEGIKRSSGTDSVSPSRAAVSTDRKWDFVIIAGLVIALGYFVWDRYYGAPVQTADHKPTAAATASTMPSLAVLPFVDFSPNKDEGYLADGLSEELMDKLAQLKGLALTGRTSAFAFKGKNEDLRSIGKKLGVENVLEGSLRKDGDQIRVTAQLINARTGYHLWSHTYQRKFDDIFAIQDDISKSVANALEVALGVGDGFNVPGMTRDVAAYDEYAHVSTTEFVAATPEQLRDDVEHLERAVALDPNFAIAWAHLAALYNNAAKGILPITIDGAADKSRQAMERALKLAPDSAYVLSREGNIAGNNGHWFDADRLYQRLRSNSTGTARAGLVDARYGIFLMWVGRMKEATGYLERARAADPLSTDIAAWLARAYAATRNYAAAKAEAARAMKLDGDHSDIIGAMLEAAMAENDKANIRKWLNLDIKSLRGGLKPLVDLNEKMMSLLDTPSSALADLHQMADDSAYQFPAIQLAAIPNWANYLGDPQFALDTIRKALRSTQIAWDNPAWSAVSDGMRKLPGFKDYVHDLGFVDYWRKTGKWNDFCHTIGDGDDFECD